MVVYDEYYKDRRVHWIEVDYIIRDQVTYPNLLGILPIIHIYNQPDDGEMFGHAEAEALLGALQRYGIVFDAAIEGNILQGRPTPVITFQTAKDLDAFWRQYGTKVNSTRADGTGESTSYLDVDLSQLITITDGVFDYKSPGSFTADTSRLLELLFYLILEHSELPEFIFGNAIASSKASAETQMPVFIEFVKMRRGEMVKWLTQIAEVALAYLSFIQPGVVEQRPEILWEPLDQDDGRLILDVVIWAFAEGLMDEETALTLVPVELTDIKQILLKARADKLRRQEEALDFAQKQMAISQPPEPLNGEEQAQNGGSTPPTRIRPGTPTANGRVQNRNQAQNTTNGNVRELVAEVAPHHPLNGKVVDDPAYIWDIVDESSGL
jgi:hypothetical protein